MENRMELAPFEGKRVQVKGYFERSSVPTYHTKTACVVDMEIESPDGDTIFIKHTWVQRANPIVNEKPLRGSRITFTAIVVPYVKSSETSAGVKMWGLSLPQDVTVDERQHSTTEYYETEKYATMPAIRQTETLKPKCTAEIVQEVKEISRKCGADVLRKTIPNIAEISKDISTCGGEDEFLKILELLC